MLTKPEIQPNQHKITETIKEIHNQGKISKYGTGAKIDAPKNFLGRKVYVLIRKD